VKKKSINIITLGCSKNLVDSEKILGQLSPDRFVLSHDADGAADIVIINTCGFINDAKEESIDTILQYAAAKKQGQIEELLVTGCLSQRYKEELIKEIPEAGAWFGVEEPHELFAYLNQRYQPGLPDRMITTPGHYAYLKIAEGCDRTCSFCAIPLIRGKFRSVPVDALVEEATQLAKKGVRELLLVAQDLSYYGIDLERKPLLGSLLNALSEIEGIEWIRLHYAYPKNFPQEVIGIMAENPKICRYLDIPIQHISDKILRSMRRGHNKKETLELLDKFREQIPGVALRTTLMVGYPGETPTEFKELMEFVRQYRFERLGVFTYSPEEGTGAYSLKDTIPLEEKQRRADQLMELQEQISLEINQDRIGERFKVIIDREEAQYIVGRTQFDSPEVDNEVLIEKSREVHVGEFYEVLIHDAGPFELFGRLETDPYSSI